MNQLVPWLPEFVEFASFLRIEVSANIYFCFICTFYAEAVLVTASPQPPVCCMPLTSCAACCAYILCLHPVLHAVLTSCAAFCAASCAACLLHPVLHASYILCCMLCLHPVLTSCAACCAACLLHPSTQNCQCVICRASSAHACETKQLTSSMVRSRVLMHTHTYTHIHTHTNENTNIY
jgi:hypothetical protein